MLTTYCRLELELDTPILEALGAYYHWVDSVVDRYRRNRRTFEWGRYHDPGVLYRIMCEGHNDVFNVHAQGLFSLYPAVQHAIVAHTGFALAYVPQQTRELCLAAVTCWGYALRYVQPHLKHRYPEIIHAAIHEAPNVAYGVPPELLVAAVAKADDECEVPHHDWLLTDTPLLV